MNFVFVCGWCEADCVIWGKPTGFWTERYWLPDEFECWDCGGDNTIPDPPWTEAD